MAVIMFYMSGDESVTDEQVKLCRKGHPRTAENRMKNGKYTTCRICKNEIARRAVTKYRRARGVTEGSANARKTHCPQGHEFTEENTYYYGPDSKSRQCKICRRARSLESYRRHRDKRVAEMKAERDANPEIHRERNRRWQQNNRERSNLLSRLKKQRRRHAGSLTVADWELVLDVYGRACLKCGKDEVTIDHVVPVSLGGANEIWNVQPLCGFCNTSKGARTADYRSFPWEDAAAEVAREDAA